MSDRLRVFLARIVVRLAALGAPERQRARLVREWEAELWHAVHGNARQAPGPGPLWHSLGVFADVRALRRLETNEGEDRSMRSWLAGWYNELRGAARGLSRSPGFAAVAVLTLGLGMGGSAAIYTLLDRIVLDPLPYPESDRLVELTNQVPGVGPDEVWNMSTAQYVYFSQHARSFDAVGLYRGLGANIQTPEGPQRAFGWRVTAGLLPLLGASVRLGRLIDVNDDRPDAPPVVVLSHGFWQRQFAKIPKSSADP